MTHEVFISYSRKDKATAAAILKSLRDREIGCWIDQQEIKPGSAWSAEIVKAIEASKVMVLVYSRHVNDSHVIASEVHEAFSRQMPILVVRIEAVEPVRELRLELSRSQWFEARPFTKQKMQLLVGAVCRLLDMAEPPVSSLTFVERVRTVGVRMIDTLTGRGPMSRIPTPRQADGALRHPGGSGEDVDVLVQQRRWHAIKCLIEARETRGMPLRDLARLRPDLARRMEAFERARIRALALIEHAGPEAADQDLARMEELVADHPDIDELKDTAVTLRREMASLRRSLDLYKREDRWVAAEMEIRGIAHRHRAATQSLLRAADIASTKAEHSMNRFDLVTWMILVGSAVLFCTILVHGFLHSEISSSPLQSLFALVARSVTVAVICVAGLALYGRRSSGTTIVLTVLFIVTGAILLGVTSVIEESSASHIDGIETWMAVGRAATVALLVMPVMLMPTTDLISKRQKLPSVAVFICTLAAAASYLPATNPLGCDAATFAFLPGALLTSSLLAVSGFISSSLAWLMLPVVAVLAGLFKESAPDGRPWMLWGGVFIITFVFASLFCGRMAGQGYLWVAAATAAGVVVNYLCSTVDHGLDDAHALLRMGPLVTLWVAACGGVALSHKGRLGRLHVVDSLRKIISQRTMLSGAKVAESRLTDTEWYRSGMAWHAARDRR